MSKHTQGPWVFNETIPRMVSSKEGYITRDICRMDSSTMQAFDQDANARLIAAAPELLELLEDVISIGGGMVEEIYGYGFVESVRAAIAKATGEQHDDLA